MPRETPGGPDYGSGQRTGLLITFLGALLLSVDTLLLRLVDGDPWQVVFWRGTFMLTSAILVNAAWTIVHGRGIGMINGVGGLFVAGCYGVSTTFFVMAVSNTTVANVLVILATAPLFAAIGSAVFLREKTPARTWAAALVAFVGIVIVAQPGMDAGRWQGDAFAILAALAMSIAFTASRRVAGNLMMAPALGGGMAALAACAFGTIERLPTIRQEVFMWIEGGLVVPIALGLIAIGPRFLPAPQVGLFLLLETVLGPLWIWTVLDEPPGRDALIGGAIVIAALAVHSILALYRTREVEPS